MTGVQTCALPISKIPTLESPGFSVTTGNRIITMKRNISSAYHMISYPPYPTISFLSHLSLIFLIHFFWRVHIEKCNSKWCDSKSNPLVRRNHFICWHQSDTARPHHFLQWRVLTYHIAWYGAIVFIHSQNFAAEISKKFEFIISHSLCNWLSLS